MTRPALDLEKVTAQMAEEARERSFGIIDPDRRAVARHGYLLALEELTRLLAQDGRVTSDHAA